MSNFLSDQDIIDLIGDIANFIGAPGGMVSQVAQPGSAQHALEPFTATLALSGMTQQVITVGGLGQRCILPTAAGGSNIVANAQQTLAIPSLNSNTVYPRYDLIVGQALHNSGPSGQASLGAQFLYSTGTAGGGPPSYTPDFAPVVQVTVRPNNATVAASDVQVVLPGVSFATLATSGGLHTLPGSGVSVPLAAAVVTASPFNAPMVAGSAQQLIAPQVDSMLAIQSALNAVGPGGAIYIPSGTYGVKTTAKTLSSNVLPSPLGQPGGGPGPVSGPIGQTIFFGGAVNFVALGDVPAFVLGDGCVTVGTPKFWDVPFITSAPSGASQSIFGLGQYTVTNIAGVQNGWANSQFAVIADNVGNVLAGAITGASGTVNAIQVDTRGTSLTTTTSGIVMLGLRSSYSVNVSDPTKFDVGQQIFITTGSAWMTAFVTQPPGGANPIHIESTAQSGAGFTLPSGSQVFGTFRVPSSTSGTLGGSGGTSPLTVSISNTLSSFAVQLAGKAETIEALYVDGWSNGVLMGPSTQFEQPYSTSGFGGGVVGSIRCDNIRGTAVQFAGKPNAHAEDTHIKHIRCGSGNAPNGGVSGIDIVNVQQNNANAITIARSGALGFNGPLGPFTGTPTPNIAGICSTGMSMRNLGSSAGSGPVNIRFAELYLSSVGTAVYMDEGCSLIDFGLLNAPGGGFGSSYTAPSGSVPSTLSGYSFFANGSTANPVNEISIGQANFLENPGSTLNSLYGIYLVNTTQLHCGFALVARKNQDGVRIGQGSASIGFDHLILMNNGQAGGYGINAVGSPAPKYVSIDKLDLSMETAASGAVNLGGATHVSYNDMGTIPLSGTYLPAGYFSSEGISPVGPVTHAFTAGVAGNDAPFAIGIINTDGSETSIGTDSLRSVAGIAGTNLIVINVSLSTQNLLSLDANGNLGLTGGLFLGTNTHNVAISAGSAVPGTSTPGYGADGIYFRFNTGGATQIYVSKGAGTPGWTQLTVP